MSDKIIIFWNHVHSFQSSYVCTPRYGPRCYSQESFLTTRSAKLDMQDTALYPSPISWISPYQSFSYPFFNSSCYLVSLTLLVRLELKIKQYSRLQAPCSALQFPWQNTAHECSLSPSCYYMWVVAGGGGIICTASVRGTFGCFDSG